MTGILKVMYNKTSPAEGCPQHEELVLVKKENLFYFIFCLFVYLYKTHDLMKWLLDFHEISWWNVLFFLLTGLDTTHYFLLGLVFWNDVIYRYSEIVMLMVIWVLGIMHYITECVCASCDGWHVVIHHNVTMVFLFISTWVLTFTMPFSIRTGWVERGRVAGGCITFPSMVNQEEWQGQINRLFCSSQTMLHPKWVQVIERAKNPPFCVL